MPTLLPNQDVLKDYSRLLDTLGDKNNAGGTINPSQDSMDDAKRPIHENRLSDGSHELFEHTCTRALAAAQQMGYSGVLFP